MVQPGASSALASSQSQPDIRPNRHQRGVYIGRRTNKNSEWTMASHDVVWLAAEETRSAMVIWIGLAIVVAIAIVSVYYGTKKKNKNE